MKDRPLTAHRIARLMTWALVWCAMALRVLPSCALGGWVDALARKRVKDMRKFVTLFILARAIKIAGIERTMARRYGRSCYPRALLRRAIGVRLRRMFGGRDLVAQINAVDGCTAQYSAGDRAPCAPPARGAPSKPGFHGL